VDGALVQSNLNQLFLVCADQVGQADQVTFLGRSVITTPYGEAAAGPLSPNDEAIAVVKLDLDDVQRARHRGPGIDPFENRRTDVYAADLGYQEPIKNPW
jgi:predicted amidohydrolase